MNFAEHRKLFVLLATMAITFTLNRLGFDAAQLGVAKTTLVDTIASAFVDLVIIGGIPAVLMWCQPNEEGDFLARYWRAILVGSAGVASLIGIIVWVA